MAILDDTRSDWNARPPTRPPHRGSMGPAHRVLLALDRTRAGHPRDFLPLPVPRPRQPVAVPAPDRRDDPWKDIGYNALVCQHARAIEGRGLDSTPGSHSPGVNWEHVGIQYMTGSDGITPTTQMVARAQFLRADLGDLGKNIRRDWGHRDDPASVHDLPRQLDRDMGQGRRPHRIYDEGLVRHGHTR